MPRKTAGNVSDDLSAAETSMRPRLDAAENVHVRDARFAELTTSMRPRLDAAENPRRAWRAAPARRTSMRPRLDAAENSSPRC